MLIIIRFFIGNLCLAMAFATERGLNPVVALFLLLAALLEATMILIEFGGPVLLAGRSMNGPIPIQPAGRVIIGLWLWRFGLKTLFGEQDSTGLACS